jgi:hypothetical protein
MDVYGVRGALMPQHVLLRAVSHKEGEVGPRAARGEQLAGWEDDNAKKAKKTLTWEYDVD